MWNEQTVETLKTLAAKGLSASVIAQELGNGCTRNMICGKLHRLGIMRGKPRVSIEYGKSPPSIKRDRNRFVATRVYSKAPVRVIEPLPEPASPASQPVTLMDIRSGLCRWPLGDPRAESFRYCGTECELTGSYCDFHHALAYQPANDRRNERRRVLNEQRKAARFAEVYTLD